MVGRRSALETPRPVSAAWTDVDLWSELEKPMAFCFLGKVQGPQVKHGKSSSKAVIVGFPFEVSLWSGVFFDHMLFEFKEILISYSYCTVFFF